MRGAAGAAEGSARGVAGASADLGQASMRHAVLDVATATATARKRLWVGVGTWNTLRALEQPGFEWDHVSTGQR
ncbi:hypothetical protein [Streptomyces violascens]|uniref:hypothetical protein n=1 Tax=Streptomyces violascens TaxID=67381 RepID=UPI0027E3E425|nr:hypothetical protein [Streptomyces violascens]